MPELRQIAFEASELTKGWLKDNLTEGRKGIPLTTAGGLATFTGYLASFPDSSGVALFTGIAAGAAAAEDLRNFDEINSARDTLVEPTVKLREETISKRTENKDFFDFDNDDKILTANTSDEVFRREVNRKHRENPLDFLANPEPYIEQAMTVTQKRSNFNSGIEHHLNNSRTRAVRNFRILPEEIYQGVVEGVENTFQRSNHEAIKNFGRELKKAEPETRRTFVEYLDSGQDNYEPGHRLVNIGKNISYIELFGDGELFNSVVRPEESDLIQKLNVSPIMPKTLQDTARLVLGGDSPSIDPREFVARFEYQDASIAETSQGEQLTQLVAERREEIGEVERLAEMAGIDPQWDAANKVKSFAYQKREIDPDELAKLLDKEIRTKRAEYTEQATINQSKRIADSMYKEITGKSKDCYNKDELAAMKAYVNFDRNQEAVEQVLRHNKGVYQMGENSKWLDRVDIDEDTLIDFKTIEYELEGERSYDLQKRRDELLEEMQQHAARLEDLTDDIDIEVEDFTSIEDFETYAEETDPDLEEEAERIYQEVFDEKIREYYDLAADDGGNGQEVKVGLATPLQTMRTGSHFSTSCLDIEKMNGWSAAADAVDVNKQTVYAWDENDNVVGRALVTVTSDETMSRYSFYTNDQRVEEPLQDYIQKYGNAVGLPLESQNKNVKKLEAGSWYSKAR